MVKWLEKSPRLVKVILALPVLDIVWAFYRLARSVKKGSLVGIILAILMIFFCPTVFWIVDLITAALANKILWIN